MAITISEQAAKVIRQALEQRGSGIGLRLGVTTSGCSGMAYILEFVDELLMEDKVYPAAGFKVIIDSKSLLYLDGTQLDFVTVGEKTGFIFNNPNQASECECGESFSV